VKAPDTPDQIRDKQDFERTARDHLRYGVIRSFPRLPTVDDVATSLAQELPSLKHVDLSGFDVQGANRVARQYMTLSQVFPKVANQISGLTSGTREQLPDGLIGHSNWQKDDSDIQLNGKLLRDPTLGNFLMGVSKELITSPGALSTLGGAYKLSLDRQTASDLKAEYDRIDGQLKGLTSYENQSSDLKASLAARQLKLGAQSRKAQGNLHVSTAITAISGAGTILHALGRSSKNLERFRPDGITGKRLEFAVAHEFGHHVHGKLYGARGMNPGKLGSLWRATGEVSQVGKTSPQEAFAEAFGQMTVAPFSKWSTYTRQVAIQMYKDGHLPESYLVGRGVDPSLF
jgi:hypothetical protein